MKKNGSLQAFCASFAEIYDIPGVLLQQEFICDRHSGVLNTQDGAHGKTTQIYGVDSLTLSLSFYQQSQSALVPLLLPLLPTSPGHHYSPKLSNCTTVPCCLPSSSSNTETDQQLFRVEGETLQRINVVNEDLGLLVPTSGFCTSNRPSPPFPCCLHQ